MKKTILFFLFIVLFIHLDAQMLITTSQMNNINSSQGAFEGQIYKNTETNIFYIGLSSGTLKTIGDLNSISANSSLTGNGTAASPLGLAQQGANSGQVLAWNGTSWVPTNAAQANTTVSNSVTSPNSLTTTVNGVTGNSVNLVTGVSNTSSNNTLSTTVNGMTSTGVNIVNTIQLELAGNLLVSRVNGIGSTAITLPTPDGSETKINSGNNTTVLGSGTVASPYTINVPDASTTLKGVIQLVGDLTGTAINPRIAANAVTYSKIQNVSGQRLLGNPTATAAAPSEISLGTGLSFTGSVLNTVNNGTVTNVIGNSPITVTNGTTTPNISITRNNIVAGTSSNSATNPLVLDAGATNAVVGGANATLTVNNTAPLWNANQLQGNTISSTAPTNGQVLKWNGSTWIPSDASAVTSVSLNYNNNVLMATVNGVNSNQVNIINSISMTSSNNSISTTVNNLTSSNVNIINSNQLSINSNQLYSTINGVNSNTVTLPSADGSETKLQNTTTINYTGLGTNGSPYQLNANNSTALWNANQLQGNPVSSNSPSSGQVLSWNGSSWTPTTSTTGWSLTGNSGTAPATNFLGTTDYQRLVFRTNNTEKMTILPGGNVGIGAPNPQNKLEITQGTAGNSGLRFTNLPNAGILATNSSGDVIIGTDIKDHHISRANSTSNVAPTSGEISNPVNGYTAKVKLNNGIIEYWTYTSGAWTLNWSETQTVNGVDIGYIVGWTSNVTPPDYLLPLTGGTYNWSDFPHLQSFHATFPCQYIASSNATTFTLVNINTSGRFLRGGLTAGVNQNGSTAMPINPFVLANDTHNHSLGLSYSTSNFTNVNYWTMAPAVNNVTLNSSSTYNTNNDSHSHTFSSGGDAETRPINTSVIWCLKVKPTSTSGNITINNITTSETTTNLTQNISTGQITYTNENSTNQTAQVVSSNSNNSINVGTDGGAYFQNPITNLTQNTTTGQITYTNENSTNQTARVVSSNANNSIQVGTDGGAYYQKDEIAIDIYNSNTTPQTLTTGSNTLQLNTIRTNLGSGFTLNNNQITVINSGTYRITFSAGITNNDYNGEYTGEYWLELNSSRVRSSTLFQNCYDNSISCSTRDLILELNAGNTLRVRMTANSNNAVETVPECNSINIEKIN
jgi:hypothetical protein